MKLRSPLAILLLLLLAGAGTFLACRKDAAKSEQAEKTPLFNEKIARKHFYKSVRPAMEKVTVAPGQKAPKLYPKWDLAQVYISGDYQIVEVPVYWENRLLITTRRTTIKDTAVRVMPSMADMGNFNRLVMYMDKQGRITQRVVSYLPDSAYMSRHHNDASHNTLNKLDKDFSGELIHRNLQGEPFKFLKVQEGKVRTVQSYNKARAAARKNNPDARWEERCTLVDTKETWSQMCTIATVDEPDGEPNCGDWVLVEVIEIYECEQVWINDDPCWINPAGPGCPGADGGPEPQEPDPNDYQTQRTLRHYPAIWPILNLNVYLYPFNTNSGGKLIVYADQPVAGSRVGVNGYNMGHTYISFEQVINGNTIRRTMGYYPTTTVTNSNITSPGQFGNDMGQEYDVKLEVDVPGWQLQSLFNTLYYAVGLDFHMDTYNCTTVAIEVLNDAGIMIPYSTSLWYAGGGCNPGALGEDMKSFSGVSAVPGVIPVNEN
ncbi:hypothetical protein [Chitinophaga barathri]|uniref:DUF4105 domain-containing protein n=1 Tax=Chitinophaga barathri TaxID=1647451 RepID=A0A3N4M8A0_9BACT|nr:hypothetical protein [Chitinophaga barathri]RPD39641.1 hypothetical protein EG028_18520 [Chitinophaga barathri]